MTAPDVGLAAASTATASEAVRGALDEAKRLRSIYNERLDADAFIPLLDGAWLAVHNGDLEARDHPALRALYDWTRWRRSPSRRSRRRCRSRPATMRRTPR